MSKPPPRSGWTEGPPLFRGFTLVELLVAIGIVSVLISLLLPALNKARGQAERIVCLSNLRQLAAAAFLYGQVNSGYFPIARDGTSEWDFQVTPTGDVPGILWGGNTNMKVQQCPTWARQSPTLTDPYTGYNYNTSFIGHGVGEAIVTPEKIARVHHPASIALFGDGQYYGGTDKYMRTPLQQTPVLNGDAVAVSTRAAGTQGFRHNGLTNVVYCDGHADSVGAIYTDTQPATYIGAGTGFLSTDNSAYDPEQ